MKQTNILAGVLFGMLAAALPAAAVEKGAAKPVHIWFVRHAESEVNIIKESTGVPDDGVSYPLTAKGVRQANQLAIALKDVPVSTLYSSTRLRTVQTADAIAFSKELTLNLAPEIVEIGVGRGSPGGEQGMAEVLAITERWAAGDDLARFGSESLRDIRQRFMAFWQRLITKHGEDEGVVVVVTHGGIMGFVLPGLCENMPMKFSARHPMPNTGIVKTELADGKLYCKEWNGVVPG